MIYRNKNICFLFLLSSFTKVYTDSERTFTQAYCDAIAGRWGTIESASGPGSTLEQTKTIRSTLPVLIAQFDIQSIIDAPCGDFHWMKDVPLNDCSYLGIDVVRPLIEKNKVLYTSARYTFLQHNLILDELPQKADLIICRDFLVHLSYEDIRKVINNFKRSGAHYLLTTSFPSRINHDIESGGWRPLNLQNAPFNFPQPLHTIIEGCTEQGGIYSDKSLMLWRLADIE